MFDTNLDGKISKSEWYNGWMVADLKNDWTLSRGDFGFFFNVYAPIICEDKRHRSNNKGGVTKWGDTEKPFSKIYDYFDANSNGVIEDWDLKRVFQNLDTNRDRKLNKAEFNVILAPKVYKFCTAVAKSRTGMGRRLSHGTRSSSKFTKSASSASSLFDLLDKNLSE